MPQRSRIRALLVLALLASLLVPLNATVASASAPAPDSLQPDGATYNSPPTLAWGHSDGAVRWNVLVARDAQFSNKIADIRTHQRQYAPSQTFADGTYYWRVRASNVLGGEVWGEYSSTATFTISRAAPTPIAPPNGTVIEYPTGSVGFSWSDIPGARTYRFEWDTEPQFTSPEGITSDSNGAWLAGSVPFDQVNYWRVRANLDGGTFSSWSAPQTFYLTWPDEVGKGRPVLTNPPTTSPLTQVTDIELEWEPVLGAGSYTLQISASSDFNGPLEVNTTVYGTTYSPPVTLLNSNYWWRVLPRTKNGDTGPWSAIGSFNRAWPASPSQGLPGVNNPPTLASPSNGAVVNVAPLKLDWNPVDRASIYEVQFADSPDFSTPVNCFTVQTVVSPNIDHRRVGGSAGECALFGIDGTPNRADLESNTWWRVRALDAPRPVLGIWSPARSFKYTATNPVPNADPFVPVVQTSPQHCPIGAVCGKHAITPEMRWNVVAMATTYVVWVAKDPNFTNIVGRYRVPATANPSLQPRDEWPDNDAGQAYYWHVQVCRTNNDISCSLSPESQGDAVSFAFQKSSTAVVQEAPGVLFDPLNPPNLDSIPILSSTPRFSWTPYLATSGSNLDARQYRIEVSDNPQFTSFLDTREVDQPFYTPFDRTYPEGPIYWRVAAIDGSRNFLTTSPIYAIRFITNPPPLVSPANGAQLTSTPTLSWQVIPNTSEYRFELYFHGTSADNAGNRVDNRSTLFSSTIPWDSLEPGWYKWRVRGYDNRDRDQAWSDFNSFRITGYSPDLLSPNDGALVDSNEIEFTWETDGANPSFYRWFISDSPDFSTNFLEQRTTINTWMPITALAPRVWYWRVAAYDTDNSLMGISDTRSFTREWDPTLLPSELTVNGSPGALNISWKAPDVTTGLQGYQVTVQPGDHTFQRPKDKNTLWLDGMMNGTEYQVQVEAKFSGTGLTEPAMATGTPNGCSGTPFRDVSSGNTFCSNIRWMYQEGLSVGNEVPGIGGVTNAVVYEPTKVLSRQAMAAFLHRYDGDDPSSSTPFFADVGTGHTFFENIQWMADTGMSLGTPNQPGKPLFKPADPVSRQATSAFLHRYNGDTPSGLTQPFFADVASGSTFFENIQWMAATEMSLGTPNLPGKPLFKPTLPVTRQTMAAFMHRYDLAYGD